MSRPKRPAAWKAAPPLDWKCKRCGAQFPEHPDRHRPELFEGVDFCGECVEGMVMDARREA